MHIDTPQLLTKDKPTNFVVSWRDGVIEVFRDNSKLFDWKDTNVFGINYYGVRTCWGAVGNWRILGAANDEFEKKRKLVDSAPKSKPLKGKG